MRLRRFALAAVLLAVTACGDSQSTDPTAPASPEAGAAIRLQPGACATPTQIRVQLTGLFDKPGQFAIAQMRFTAVVVAVAQGKTDLAQERMYRLLQFVLDRYARGDLRGGKASATQAKLVDLILSLFCFVGLPQPDLSALALGPDGAIALILPETPDTTVVTETRFAGVEVPAGSVTEPTLLTIQRLPNTPGPLNTPLDQYPAFYEFSSSAASGFTNDVVVGACQVQDFTPPDYSRLLLGHNVGSGIELLPRVPAPFLDCTGLLGAIEPGVGWFRYALRGWRAVEPFAAALLLPREAHATVLASCCLGGSTRSFSPFGAVDPLVLVSAVSPTSLSGSPGAVIPAGDLPSVRVLTPTGQPVPGLTVTFAVPSGSEGSITGAVQVTDLNGVATVGGWTLGSGAAIDSVVATVTPLPGSTVQGDPVLFTATVTTLVSWGAGGYRYLLIESNEPPAGWPTQGFNDGAWPVGIAAFGSGPGATSCPLDGTVNTSWPAAPVGVSTPANPVLRSEIVVRRSFTVPAGWGGGVVVKVAVDNDVRIFVNGNDLTLNAVPPNIVSEFQVHEGCPVRGSVAFTVPAALLHAGGPNLVAVRARDRGESSYLDLEISLLP